MNDFVFVPETKFNQDQSCHLGDTMGTVSAGVAHASGFNLFATALQISQSLDPVLDDQRSLGVHQARILQNIHASQTVHAPAGAGSVPGVWISRDFAEDMGIIPRDMFDDFDMPIKTQAAYNNINDKNTILNKLVEKRVLSAQQRQNSYKKKI